MCNPLINPLTYSIEEIQKLRDSLAEELPVEDSLDSTRGFVIDRLSDIISDLAYKIYILNKR